MLATIARFGESGWVDYWHQLRANGVLVVDGWEEAYTAQFSGAGGSKGKRPIVVSYATSPRGRGDLREAAPEGGADRRGRVDAASARSSSPACSPGRRTWTARAR